MVCPLVTVAPALPGTGEHAMMLTGLERLVLEAAAVGQVLEEPESASAVGAVYRALDAQGLVEAEWWGGDDLPLQVTLTAAGRTLLRSRVS